MEQEEEQESRRAKKGGGGGESNSPGFKLMLNHVLGCVTLGMSFYLSDSWFPPLSNRDNTAYPAKGS